MNKEKKVKRHSLIIFITLILINGICFADSSTQVYRNPKMNFQIDYPLDWIVQDIEVGGGGKGIAFAAPEGNRIDGFIDNFIISRIEAKGKNYIEEYLKAFFQQAPGIYPNFNLVDRGEIIVGGVPAKYITFTNLDQATRSVKIKHRYYYIRRGSVLYRITCTSSERGFYENISKIENAVMSFKVLK
ncbi:MAG: PsbP-related protein [Candidatus Omnitrophota bacterium]